MRDYEEDDLYEEGLHDGYVNGLLAASQIVRELYGYLDQQNVVTDISKELRIYEICQKAILDHLEYFKSLT